MEKSKSSSTVIIWPWKGKDNTNLSFFEFFKSRKFSIFYLIAIWSLVAALDFGSTRNCGPTWQLGFICEQSIWIGNLYTAPLSFIASLFTAILFHNGLDHILFVTIIGILIMVQSFEARNGMLPTIILFYATIIFIATSMAILINWGFNIWPEIEFYNLGMKRSWIGGSVGASGVFGALAHSGKKPWLIPLIVILFEFMNFFFLDINLQISVAHIGSTLFGFTIWGLWLRYQKKNQFS